MPKRTVPTPAPQATANCPKCNNTVYSDRLRYSDHFVDGNGFERPGKLHIDCPTCEKLSVITYQR